MKQNLQYKNLFIIALRKMAYGFFGVLIVGGLFSSVNAQDFSKKFSDRFTSFGTMQKDNLNPNKDKVSALRTLSILNSKNLKAKAAGTPFNIGKIDRFYYDSEFDDWENDYTDEYALLSDRNGYAITYYYGVDGEIVYDFREEYVFDENDRLILSNG